LGASYGGFGGGTGDNLQNFSDRFDFDAVAYWEVRNLGFGEQAARHEARARVDEARFRELQVMDTIAREIVEAQAQIESRRQQIEIARLGIESSTRSYERNLERIRNVQGLPIEVLQSLLA